MAHRRILGTTLKHGEASTRDGPRSSRHAQMQMHSGLGPCQFDDSGQGPCDISHLVEQIEDLYRMESGATIKADLAMQARPG